MLCSTYFCLFFMAVYWAMGAIEDPASLPSPSKRKPNLWDSLKCGVAEHLQTVSQRAMLKVNCKQLLKLEDSSAMILTWRSTLPTTRHYQGWKRDDPAFAEMLYRSLVVADGGGGGHHHVAVSPPGLWMGLAVLAVGAVGDTKREILQALGVSAATLTTHCTDLLGALDAQKPSPLKVISKFYLDQEFHPIGGAFKNQMSELRAQFEKANFKKRCEAEITKINDGVSIETGGIIKDAVSKETANENTNLLLLNVLYFDGKWEIPFPKNMGFNGKFYTSEGNYIETTYMSQVENNYFYKEVVADEYKMLELPYAYDIGKPPQFSLIIILPDKLDGLSKLLELITEDHKWLQNYDIESSNDKVLIKLTIPRFTVDAKLELKPALKKLGISKVFEESEDVKDISQKNFKLSSIQQRIYTTVNEKDADIASYSVDKSSAAAKDGSSVSHPAKTFVADHPFAFALIQRATKTIIVMGQVMRPG